MSVTILGGDCRDVLATLPAESVQCVVTSPPYYGLRDYGTAQWDGGDGACDHRLWGHAAGKPTPGGRGGSMPAQEVVQRERCGKCGATRIDSQIGLEQTPELYVAELVAVFREVRRVLRPDGVLFLNLGDSYAGGNQVGWRNGNPDKNGGNSNRDGLGHVPGCKPKDLLMVPARVALALQADGWWLRSDIIWHKPNPMPESVTDRPTSAHEHVFLLAKSARYYWDADAVREEPTGRTDPIRSFGAPPDRQDNGRTFDLDGLRGRNIRNVWTIATQAFSGAHFAVFPPELAERCIKAGSKPGDTILDPFAGAFTTPLAADRLQRNAIGIELNVDYCDMARKRLVKDAGMFMEIADAPRPEPPAIGDLFDFSERDPRCEPRPDWTPPEWLRLPGVDPP